MILYMLLNLFDTLCNFVISLFPVFETPAWLVTHLPQIFSTVFGFNQYLPIYEAVVAVVLCITLTIAIRVISAVVSKLGIKLWF